MLQSLTGQQKRLKSLLRTYQHVIDRVPGARHLHGDRQLKVSMDSRGFWLQALNESAWHLSKCAPSRITGGRGFCPRLVRSDAYWMANVTWIWVPRSSSPGAIPPPPRPCSTATIEIGEEPMTSLTDST